MYDATRLQTLQTRVRACREAICDELAKPAPDAGVLETLRRDRDAAEQTLLALQVMGGPYLRYATVMQAFWTPWASAGRGAEPPPAPIRDEPRRAYLMAAE